MGKQEFPLTYLQYYLPAPAAAPVYDMLQQYKVHLTITKERKTVLGDYRHASQHAAHRISVNGNLNHYAFLITLIHELAHLVTFIEFGNRVQAHGREWKQVYKMLLITFLQPTIFPTDVLASLRASLNNLPASSCADEELMRVLRRYDAKEEGVLLVEELPDGALFTLQDGKVFKKAHASEKDSSVQKLKPASFIYSAPSMKSKKFPEHLKRSSHNKALN